VEKQLIKGGGIMAKIIIEIDFEDKPKTILNMVKGAIEQELKTQVKAIGISEDKVKVKIEE